MSKIHNDAKSINPQAEAIWSGVICNCVGRCLSKINAHFSLLLIFLVLLVCSIFAEFIANEKPLFISKDSKMYFPVFVDYQRVRLVGIFKRLVITLIAM